MAQALFTNVQRFSIHDGGGIRTVVFLKGCPFRCPWCSNPETLSFEPQTCWHESLCVHCSMAPGGNGLRDCPRSPEECPTTAKETVGKPASVEDLLDLVRRDRVFYEESNGGVTVSGGECLAGPNQDLTVELLRRCHEEGIGTAIETTLAVPVRDMAALVAAADALLVDFKIADPRRSREVIGLDVGLRDKNLRAALSLGARVVARMPIIPGFTDSAENVRANVERIVELGIGRADVLPFHQLGQGKYDSIGRPYSLAGLPQLTEDDVADVVAACEAAGLVTVVHGE